MARDRGVNHHHFNFSVEDNMISIAEMIIAANTVPVPVDKVREETLVSQWTKAVKKVEHGGYIIASSGTEYGRIWKICRDMKFTCRREKQTRYGKPGESKVFVFKEAK